MVQTVRITGSGRVVAGTYDGIKISGSGKIIGDVICNSLKVSGFCSSEGKVETQKLITSGTYKAAKEIKANEMRIDGTFNGEDDIRVKHLIINGVCKVDTHYVNAETIEVNGSLSNAYEINVDNMNVNGVIKAKDIVGTTITIFKHADFSLSNVLFLFGIRKMWKCNSAESITCEKLFARGLHCQKISADDITLRECNVNFIECNGVLRVDSHSKIGEIEGHCEIIRE